MNTKKHMLTLVVGALLTAGAANVALANDAQGYDKKGYDQDGYNRNGYDRYGYNKSGTDSHGHSKPANVAHDADSDLRGKGDSAHDKSKQKVVICHVPKGNPANSHTIHISMSAWPAHRDNHGGDYLGSCNAEIKKTVSVPVTQPDGTSKTVDVTTNNLPTVTPEPVHTISGCKGEARTTLVGKLQSYYNPIIVTDDALDDAAVVAAVSQCLNNGDSSDSGRGGHNHADSNKNKVQAKEDSNKVKSDSLKNKAVHKRDGNH
jgi:hypothetical protein